MSAKVFLIYSAVVSCLLLTAAGGCQPGGEASPQKPVPQPEQLEDEAGPARGDGTEIPAPNEVKAKAAEPSEVEVKVPEEPNELEQKPAEPNEAEATVTVKEVEPKVPEPEVEEFESPAPNEVRVETPEPNELGARRSDVNEPAISEEVAESDELQSEASAANEVNEVNLILQFEENQDSRHRVVRQSQRIVKFEGPLAEDTPGKGGHNDERLELTYTRHIESVADDGSAVAGITIEEIKYLSIVKDDIRIDFDSNRESQKQTPLARLIGTSYRLKLAPDGTVESVVDINEPLSRISGRSLAEKAGMQMFSPDSLKQLHGTLVLPDPNKMPMKTTQTWSNVKDFSFGFMGSDSYERIYSFDKIEDVNGSSVAFVEMNSIPAAPGGTDPEEAKAAAAFSSIFDNEVEYAGNLEFNLSRGSVKMYREKLDSKWTAIDPDASEGEVPGVLKMGAIRFYSIEKIDNN